MSDTVILSAFGQDAVARLTGLTKRQLSYWDTTDFFKPSFGHYERGSGHSRIYSFRDVVALRVLHALRNEANVPLPHLREVRERLLHLGDDLWAKTTLYVVKRRVAFVNPETAAMEDVVSGQGVLQIPLDKVSGETRDAVNALMRRDPSTIGKIERRKEVAGNQPIVAGTRIPVSGIRSFAEAGFSVEQIRREYPTLTARDVEAALAYEAA